MSEIIYMASPYTSTHATQEHRYSQAVRALAHFCNQGLIVYSPIVHAHVMSQRFRMPGDHEFWIKHDQALIRASKELWVLALSGWEESRGVTSEIAFAHQLGIPVTIVAYEPDVWLKRSE